MKNYKLNLILFCVALFAHQTLRAQVDLKCNINFANDTAVSLYDYNKCSVSVRFTNNDPNRAAKTPESSNFFQIKYSNTDWIKYPDYTSSIDHSYIIASSYNKYLNLSYLILNNDTLRALLAQNGLMILVRYKFVTITKGVYETKYSNIDSIFVPRANDQDIEGGIYLKNSEIDLFDFTHGGRSTGINELIHIRDAFPNSLLSELARLFMVSYDAALLIEPIDEGYKVPPAVKAMIQSVYDSLSNSKSEYIRYKIKEYNDFMQAQPD
jgi:hypothetical protein